MGAITWGLNRDRLATVFCMNCRAVFAREVSANEAAGIVECASKQHHCIPPKLLRPVRTASIAGVIRCDRCGHEFSDSLGKYGCPNCAE